MANKYTTAVEALVEEIEAKSREVAELKRTVNFLRNRDGDGPLYPETEEPSTPGHGLVSMRPDQFYGKSPTTAAREYLEMRGQAVPAEEIAEALERGAFDYKAQGWSNKETRARNLAISMSKNSLIFHRLPNGLYGLTKWYPDVKKKPRTGPPQESEPEEDAEIIEGEVELPREESDVGAEG